MSVEKTNARFQVYITSENKVRLSIEGIEIENPQSLNSIGMDISTDEAMFVCSIIKKAVLMLYEREEKEKRTTKH